MLVGLAAMVLAGSRSDASLQDVQTVFIILMENRNWSSIKGSASAPYINGTLLPMASYATQYFTPTGLHPSEPNYIWLEAGSNLGITTDADPSSTHSLSTTAHLVTQLKNAGISWTSYQENISAGSCPIVSSGLYAAKHNPMIFFNDVSGAPPSTSSSECIAHVRPYTELATDLANNTVARYNFLTPNLCNDMHGGTGCPTGNALITQGDTWLSNSVSAILSSQTYSNGGAVFIVWDEGVSPTADGPIGMIVISRLAKGGGYTNTIHYTHSSTLRTLQEIFNVSPLLGDAVNATDLSDLFNPFPGVTNLTPSCGGLAGGTSITITGSNFVNGATVTIGGQAASNIVFVSTTTLTAKTPAAAAGTQPVVVKNPDTQTATLPNAFTYVAPPSFAGLTGVVAGVESATLTWSAASGTGPMTYRIYQGTTPGGENFASPVSQTTGPPVFISALDPGSTNAITYYFVCRASDACGNSESNNVEQSVQPLLDPTKDQDGDGIPNGYEQAHGMNAFDAADANADNDGDGFSNLQEYQEGTDPNDNNSFSFRVTAIARENNDVHITWMTGLGKTNALERSTGDVSGSYSNNFAAIFSVTNTVGTTTNYLDLGATTNSPALYYRIRLVP